MCKINLIDLETENEWHKRKWDWWSREENEISTKIKYKVRKSYCTWFLGLIDEINLWMKVGIVEDYIYKFLVRVEVSVCCESIKEGCLNVCWVGEVRWDFEAG